MPNENAEQGEQIGIGMFAVGFFDLLGQQERLRSIRDPLVTDDVQAKQQVKDAMTETYNAVWAMRNDFGSAFNAYTRNSNTVALAALTEAQRAEFATLVSEPIRFRGFSDSMVAYLPLRTQENAKLPVRGIYGLIAAAALATTTSLARGHPIRGGIDVGLGIINSDGEIYGPALSRAYTLESRIANYPRIVVGDDLMRYLAFLAADRTDSAQGRSSSKLAKNCLELLTYDQDGYPIVDHIGKHIHDAVAKKVDGSVVRKAYDNARANAEQFKTERNTKLAFRYGLLLNYLEDRLPIWDDVLRKAQPPKNEESAK